MLHSTLFSSLLTAAVVSAALTENNLKTYVGSLSLSSSFVPVKEAYWTGLPHHRRTPFAVSPDGKSAYLAYLDASGTDVHVQQVDPSTFVAVGDAVTITGGKEAGGLVAHNDGFALLTNEQLASGTTNADNAPVAVLYRYTSGTQTWKTFLGGPDVPESSWSGLVASPDINGDLVYSEAAKKYGAYIVVTSYSGDAAGHFGDAIRYVSDSGEYETIAGASSDWGCSHNTGIAFEAADEPPFASICAEDQGAIWLNTKTQGMSNNGVKISNENTTNGASGESLGGMSGSYSHLARFTDSDSYIFTWVSKGAKDLTENTWMGAGYTHSINRTPNRNVAIAQFSDKNTIVGEQATSDYPTADGDSQVNWLTTGTADNSNAHVAAFDGANALVTYEEIAEPSCEVMGFGCSGEFTGSYFQLVNDGKAVGEPVKRTDVYVAGDMVTMGDGRICWPYVDMAWDLSGPVSNPASVTKISFACMSLDGSTGSTSPSASATATPSVTSVQEEGASTTSVDLIDTPTSFPVTTGTFSVLEPSSATSIELVETPTSFPVGTGTFSVPEPSSTTSIDLIEVPTSFPVGTGTFSVPEPSSTTSIDVIEAPTSFPVGTGTFSVPEPSSAPADKTSATSPTGSMSALPIFDAPSATAPTSSESALPIFSIVSSTSEAAVPTSDAAPVASEAPASTTAVSEPSTTCTKGTVVPTNIAEAASSATSPVFSSGVEPPFPIPSGTGFQTGFPTGTAAPYPSSGWPNRGRPGHHGHAHPSGRPVFGGPGPSGYGNVPENFRPRPTASRGSGAQGPSKVAEAVASVKTPCPSTLTTVVRPRVTVTVSQ